MTAATPTPRRPLIGTALVIRHYHQILLQERQGGYAAGHWGCPGGHLEMWEDLEDAVLRELREEAGGDLFVTRPRLWTVVNCPDRADDKHYVTLVFHARWLCGAPHVMEPEKCRRWQWWDWEQPPQPLMLGLQQLREMYPRVQDLPP